VQLVADVQELQLALQAVQTPLEAKYPVGHELGGTHVLLGVSAFGETHWLQLVFEEHLEHVDEQAEH
jgi:hypothetical protein